MVAKVYVHDVRDSLIKSMYHKRAQSPCQPSTFEVNNNLKQWVLMSYWIQNVKQLKNHNELKELESLQNLLTCASIPQNLKDVSQSCIHHNFGYCDTWYQELEGL